MTESYNFYAGFIGSISGGLDRLICNLLGFTCSPFSGMPLQFRGSPEMLTRIFSYELLNRLVYAPPSPALYK